MNMFLTPGQGIRHRDYTISHKLKNWKKIEKLQRRVLYKVQVSTPDEYIFKLWVPVSRQTCVLY